MTVLVGVLLASLAGSLHCAAMCGGFVCVYTGTRRLGAADGPPFRAHVAYNAGRLTGYAGLGALAGVVGGRVDRLGGLIGLGRAAAIVAGVLMVLWALTEIATALGARVGLADVPGAGLLRRAISTGILATRDASPTARAGTLGVLTALLPCGWLYAFVASAAATGSGTRGALLMVAFWAGTVPMLLGVGLGARRALGPFARRLPLVGAMIVLALGLLSIGGRLPRGAHLATSARVGTAHGH